MNKKLLIITGGKIDEDDLKDYLSTNKIDVIIAVDSGLIIADQLGINVDHIVGDFDSTPIKIFNKYKDMPNIHVYSPIKDESDTELALDLAKDLCLVKGIKQIDILGGTGNRIDHLLANISLLSKTIDDDISTCIIDKKNKIYIKNSNFTIQKCKQYGDFISLIPFSDNVYKLSLKGFKYELQNKTLTKGNSLGISNEIIEDEGFVELEKGILIVIESKD
ncbi:MAG TPA: thiamine diphosphokinase [Clostridiales bacterium]|nr:thiamine diphosphokinase [Clostridiales bacterium]